MFCSVLLGFVIYCPDAPHEFPEAEKFRPVKIKVLEFVWVNENYYFYKSNYSLLFSLMLFSEEYDLKIFL